MSNPFKDKGGRPKKLDERLRGVAGGLKSNIRLKNQRLLRQDLPVAMKHKICETIFGNRLEFASEEMLMAAMAKKFSMRSKRLKMIWKKRAHWKQLVEKHQQSQTLEMRTGRGAHHGVHGTGAVKHVKMRAAGGGQKLEFPEVYEKVKNWVEMERSHGHSVLKRHISWKYMEFLRAEHVVLKEKMESGHATNNEKVSYEKSMKQLQALENPRNQEKRAEHLMRWMGAKQLVPNLKTTISEVEQEVRACLTWQYHDSQMHRMAAKRDEDMRQLFARPDEAKANMSKAVLGFSDQIPLWVKMGSEKEIFAAHEVRTSGRTQKAHRMRIAENMREQAQAKGTSAQTLEDEKKEEPMSSVADERNQQLVEHEEDEFHVSDAKSQAASGKTHETVQREISDKYRITFEAHQLVTHWFDESHDPVGHVLPGILIVPGPHASMSNINENDEWIQSESFEYMGQVRHHVAGQKVGRVLEPWRRLRKERPDLFRHFRVMSQPASNMDGILMSWQIREQSAMYPMSLWQRDCFGAVFTDQVRQSQFIGHQVQATIMGKMTSAMQLTDTDFSHEFKSHMRREVDEKRRLGMMRQRADVAAPSDIHKLSIREIAECLDMSMQKMIDKNDKKQWVLAGLRRNGFLVMRPDQQGKMVHQIDQPWCQDKPIGSSRISQTWLKNRLSWVKERGMKVEPPVWERIEGAKELADLIEWSYSHENPKKHEMIDLDELPDWVEACQFQLPLDLRRQLALKESTMSEARQARRSKLKEKRQQRKLRNEAKAALNEEEREEIRSNLKSGSRMDAMLQMVPSARAKAKAKSKSKAKSEGRIAKEKEKAKNKKKTGERAIQKGQQKELMRKETVKAFKKMKSDEKVESQAALPPADELPLPAPVEPPPEYEKPAGKWRVISEQAVTLYGRQGDILSASEDQYQILFDADVRYNTEKLSWVRQEYCMRVDELPHPHTWQFPQLSISRTIKQWILHETGTINEDIDEKDIAWDSVEVLSKECPPGGLEAQTVQYGWLLMRYFCSGKSMNELENITMLDPMLCHALGAVKKEEEHGLELDKLIQLFKREMSHKKTFFLPLMSGGHWALLVVDKIHEDIRYYDSLCGDPDRSKIGTEDEITNLPEKCLAMAERLLGAMMSLSVVPDGFCDRPALRRANVRTRQPWGTNQCGHFILAYMEAELLNELGYGPAASGWPAASAHHWHERLRKLTHQLHEEIPKYKRDLKAADEKVLRAGERAHAEMVKEAKMAQMRLDKQETLTELQKTAYEFVHENRYIKISELPPECEKDRMRIIHHEVGVCSRCRNQSGCLNCNEWKCIRAYMRKEHKRTGRPIEPQYI
eukprot:Skav229316  [mRNA]  locus=scaffold2616:95961:99953:+ [translate_table: standard]